MKRDSEGRLREALKGLDEDLPILVYKPPDDARNWKPCDYLVWFCGPDRGSPRPAFFEVKDTPAADLFPTAEIRTSQKIGIREAARLGIPYWLAVWWQRHRLWTLSRATELDLTAKSIKRSALASPPLGIEATAGNLGSILRSILEGELD